MPTSNNAVRFKKEELRGSRPRCLVLTLGSRKQVASRLSRLIAPYGSIDAEQDTWMPRGFREPEEARLGVAAGLLPADEREALTAWWLAVRGGANTPNWDIASTCAIAGGRGLLLVEAKAHDAELNTSGKPDTGNPRNHRRIRDAINEANNALEPILPGWVLSRDTHYQLANRFAWAWKVASLRIPVALVYLGFLEADDVADLGQPFPDHTAWMEHVHKYADGIVPRDVWGKSLSIGDTPLIPLIRSIALDFTIQAAEECTV